MTDQTQKKITVIITFYNEKQEVENTIESVKEFSSNIDILVINDASDDGFNYDDIIQNHDILYIKNNTRLGVAASRDLGVKNCKTPYFLLLDAHMRFYDNKWVDRISSELDCDNRTLLCCQTASILTDKNGKILENQVSNPSFGAYINLKDTYFEPVWIKNHSLCNSLTVTIPCVLGAGYACSKKYWQYLKGLNGLVSYGNDEPYISLKVWLEGGSCKLLKNVVIGHIYRLKEDTPFYANDLILRLYNRLFLAELLLPCILKRKFYSWYRYTMVETFNQTMLQLFNNRTNIIKLKDYYRTIFNYEYSYFEKFNKLHYPDDILNKVTEDSCAKTLNEVFLKIQQNTSTASFGLLNGEMGKIIFLFHYSVYVDNNEIRLFAEDRLDNLLTRINGCMYYGLNSGLSGIGWGIEYLNEQGFINGDTNEILEEFDGKIMEISAQRINDLSQENGLGGIVLYLLARLYSIEKNKKENPFDYEYLTSIYNRIYAIIQKSEKTNSLDTFIRFINYYERVEVIEQPTIYDIRSSIHFDKDKIKLLTLDLNGSVGIGIDLIFNKTTF